jgi:hypothetical protein
MFVIENDPRFGVFAYLACIGGLVGEFGRLTLGGLSA